MSAAPPTAEDRACRLAAVALGWNVFQHFYPYFDVVETDWEAVLPDMLARAAEDPDAEIRALARRSLERVRQP